jgi:hypothetical protein
LELVSEATNGDDMDRFGLIRLDLDPQPADVDVDDPSITEVVVPPDPFEELLAAEDPGRALRHLAQQTKLGSGEMHVLPGQTHHTLGGDDLERAGPDIDRSIGCGVAGPP